MLACATASWRAFVRLGGAVQDTMCWTTPVTSASLSPSSVPGTCQGSRVQSQPTVRAVRRRPCLCLPSQQDGAALFSGSLGSPFSDMAGLYGAVCGAFAARALHMYMYMHMYACVQHQASRTHRVACVPLPCLWHL